MADDKKQMGVDFDIITAAANTMVRSVTGEGAHVFEGLSNEEGHIHMALSGLVAALAVMTHAYGREAAEEHIKKMLDFVVENGSADLERLQ